MSCIKCKNLETCGTIKRWLIDFNQSTLISELNKDSSDCKDFSFLAISGTVLKDKILKMVEISKQKKESLKRANKANSKNRLY
jgi:hypothetical protein